MCIVHSLIESIKSDIQRSSNIEKRWLCRIDLIKPILQIITQKNQAQIHFLNFLKLDDMRVITYQVVKYASHFKSI